MNLRDGLMLLARTYAEGKSLSLSRVGTLIFNDGKTFSRLADGGDLTTANYERSLLWFSDNWPEGLDWPPEIERPALTPAA